MKTKKPKTTFDHRIKCRHCGKLNTVRKTKILVEPAKPAVYEEKLIIEKDAQKTLPEVTKGVKVKRGRGRPPKIKGLTKEQKEYIKGKQQHGADAIDQDAQIRSIKA